MIPTDPKFLPKPQLPQPPLVKQVARFAPLAQQWPLLKAHLAKLRPSPSQSLLDRESDRPSQVSTAPQNFPVIALPGLEPLPSYYPQYPCTTGTSLNCAEAWRAVQADPMVVACPVCGFPAPLAEQSIVVGQQGSYRVGRCLGQRGISRVYEAVQMGAEIPVTLREYVLPKRYFNDREQTQWQAAFLNLTGLSLADGRSQDLRVMAPLEAIAPPHEERAYLVLPAEDQTPSLSHILSDRPPMGSGEVYLVLRQVLQTLAALHRQKYVISPGRIQIGAVHGNLRLSSLLWVTQGTQQFIYLTDFAIWEECFNPSVVELPAHQPEEDLAALGLVAFQLLAGRLSDASGQRLQPKQAYHWPVVSAPLKHFILRLLAIELPFANATAAHQALLQLPPETIVNHVAPYSKTDLRSPLRGWRNGIPILLGMSAIALLGWLLWSLLRPKPLEATNPPSVCCFAEVSAVPEGSFTYTGITGDVWEQLLQLKPLENPSQTVEQKLAADQPKLHLTYQPSNSIDEALAKLRTREADFAVLPLLGPLPVDMASEVVGYDGLAVVVAFNYQGRSQGLPERLQGSLSLETLQDVYQEPDITWRRVKPSIQLPLQRYMDRSAAIQTAMQHFILTDERASGVVPTALNTIPMLRAVIRDFEVEQIGSIGITSLSSIEGQCSVYPLAIQISGRPPVQPFRLANGQPIQPNVDLCRRKGTYKIDPEVLRSQRYPLAYPIAFVYRRDNRLVSVGDKVAALFLTTEGQSYLRQANITGMLSTTTP